MAQLNLNKISAGAAALVLIAPAMIGCGGPEPDRSGANLPPVDDTRAGYGTNNSQRAQTIPQEKKGMSTGTKVAILAGAAALYYMYNKQKNKPKEAVGADSQYYLSKNGRVYYRDEQGRAHWVTPPTEGIRVPESEAWQYRDYQGFNNRSDGRTLVDLYNQQQGG
jgi:hypothetical protein